MISSQAQREFSLSNSEYNKIKKVYSIWICFNPPEYMGDTIISYKITPELLYSNNRAINRKPINYGRYNLQEIVIINLGKGSDSGNILQQFLKTLLSDELSRKDKADRLINDFEFELNNDINKELNTMCNLGEGLWEKGKLEGKEEGRIEGKEEGKLEGRLEGKAEERKNNINIFTNILISKGYSKEEAENIIAEGFSNTDNNGALVM